MRSAEGDASGRQPVGLDSQEFEVLPRLEKGRECRTTRYEDSLPSSDEEVARCIGDDMWTKGFGKQKGGRGPGPFSSVSAKPGKQPSARRPAKAPSTKGFSKQKGGRGPARRGSMSVPLKPQPWWGHLGRNHSGRNRRTAREIRRFNFEPTESHYCPG